MNCYEAKENFGALIDGELNGTEKEALLSHIAECDECRAEYEELRRLKKEFSKLSVRLDGELAKSAMARIQSQAKPASKKTPFYFRYIGTAAALVIIACLFFYTRLAPANESAQNDSAHSPQTESVTIQNGKFQLSDMIECEDEEADLTPNEAPMPDSALSEPALPESVFSDTADDCEPSYVIDIRKIGVIFVDVEVEDLVPLFDNVEKVDKYCLTVNSTPQDVVKVLTQNSIEVLNTNIPTDVESTTIIEQE